MVSYRAIHPRGAKLGEKKAQLQCGVPKQMFGVWSCMLRHDILIFSNAHLRNYTRRFPFRRKRKIEAKYHIDKHIDNIQEKLQLSYGNR